MVEKVNLRDSYKYYKTCNPASTVDVKIYLYIITGFVKFIMQKVFDGFDVELAGGRSLGTIGIRGKKLIPKLEEQGNMIHGSVDWGATRKLWESNHEAKKNKVLLKHLNEHTNGIAYNLLWWPTGMKIGNKRLYNLVFCKPNKRKASAYFFSGREYLVRVKQK